MPAPRLYSQKQKSFALTTLYKIYSRATEQISFPDIGESDSRGVRFIFAGVKRTENITL